MTDLVKQLRGEAWCQATTIGPMLDEAADRIEQLEDALNKTITPGSGNVFADIGFTQEDYAAKLQRIEQLENYKAFQKDRIEQLEKQLREIRRFDDEEAATRIEQLEAEIGDYRANETRLGDRIDQLEAALREANGRRNEFEHAMGHIIDCGETNLCKDCARLAKASLAG